METDQSDEVAQLPTENPDAAIVAEKQSDELPEAGDGGEDSVADHPTADGEKPEEVRKRSVEDDEAAADGDGEPPSKKNRQDDDDDEETPAADPVQNGEETVEKKRERSLELAKFWKTVEDDPSDFTGWTYLLQFVDNHGDLDEGREAFDAFLFKYPYCYGYWKKFADFEKRLGTRESCVAVFERGVKSIPLSADLWIHFMNYVKVEFSADEDFVRQTYERAVLRCGKEWRSDKLWDHYVKWELSLQEAAEPKDFRRILKLYDQILVNPTQGLASQFDMFREFVKDHSPKDMLEPADFLALRKEVIAALNGGDEGADKKETEDDAEAAPGEVGAGVRAEEENLAMKVFLMFFKMYFYPKIPFLSYR